MERYQAVTLSADFMFENGIIYFIMISHHIDFITTLVTKDQRIKTVIKIIKEVAAHFLKLGVRI